MIKAQLVRRFIVGKSIRELSNNLFAIQGIASKAENRLKEVSFEKVCS